MMALIDRIRVMMDELETASKERAKELARDLLRYAGQVDDYELAQEMEDMAYEYLKGM